MDHDFFFDRERETLPRANLEAGRRLRLEQMLQTIVKTNVFYRRKFQERGWSGAPKIEDWLQVPFTTKLELANDAETYPPYGSNLTYPLEQYVRLHQTSGTTGKPLVVLDTFESWESWKKCWGYVYRAAGVVPGDRVFAAFSFGPFIGFWAAFEAGTLLGLRMLSGGGQSSVQRLAAIQLHRATVLVCTPSYALHLAEVGREQGIDTASTSVRATIHAGEPGASIPATKRRIEQAWGAKCFDHIGASEVGAWGFECHLQPGGVHVNELDYIPECIDPATLQPVRPGEVGELVLTNLNRWGYPVIRYRTGDLVRLSEPGACCCGRLFRMLLGGILGRVDDMMTIRGVNLFPTAIEAVVREFKEVVEFECHVSTHKGMDELLLKVEVDGRDSPQGEQIKNRLQMDLRNRLGLRVEIELAPPGSLPRYELKARRFKHWPQH